MDNGSSAWLTLDIHVETDSGDLPDPERIAEAIFDAVGTVAHTFSGGSYQVTDINANEDYRSEDEDTSMFRYWLVNPLSRDRIAGPYYSWEEADSDRRSSELSIEEESID